MADVMPNSVKAVVIARQMFFALIFDLADVIANEVADILPLQCIATIGRLMLMPVADGIATCWLFVYMFLWADVIALWQME